MAQNLPTDDVAAQVARLAAEMDSLDRGVIENGIVASKALARAEALECLMLGVHWAPPPAMRRNPDFSMRRLRACTFDDSGSAKLAWPVSVSSASPAAARAILIVASVAGRAGKKGFCPPGEVGVRLVQNLPRDFGPQLMITHSARVEGTGWPCLLLPLREAADFIALMRALGHEDIAAAVEQVLRDAGAVATVEYGRQQWGRPS